MRMQKILDLQKSLHMIYQKSLQKSLHMIYQNFSLEKGLPRSKCTIIIEKQLAAGPGASSLE